MEAPHPSPTNASHLLVLGAQGETILRRVSLVLFFGVGLAGLVIQMPLWPVSTFNASYYCVLFITGSCWYLTLRGWSSVAAIWLTAGLLLEQVFNATQITGVRTPGLLIALPVTVTIAAWLGGLRAALVIAAMGAVSTLGLLAAELTGLIHPNVQRPLATYAALLLVGIAATVAVQYSSLRAFNLQLIQLHQAQARSAALLHGNPVPISTLDAQGRFVDVNDAWLHVFGCSRDSVLGRTSEELALWRDLQSRKEFMALMRTQDTVIGYPAWLRAEGEDKLFSIHAARIAVDNTNHYAITLLDMSDRLAADRAQRAVQDQLEARVAQRTTELRSTIQQLETAQAALVQSEKLASLGALVAGMAHELNTPVGTNLTLATTIQKHISDLREKLAHDNLRKSDLTEFLRLQDEMAEVVVRNAQRSADLVSSFKQVAVDRTSERLRTFRLIDLVQDTQRALQPSLRKKALHITHDLAPDITLHGYPGAVGQILTNLIQNAAVHAFGDSSEGEIHIRAHTTAQQSVVLEVQDNGCGMDDTTTRKVFDPFFTTRMGQGGSGLGLSIAYNLATVTLQGSLTVRSTPEKGSCFRLEFPQNQHKPSGETSLAHTA